MMIHQYFLLLLVWSVGSFTPLVDQLRVARSIQDGLRTAILASRPNSPGREALDELPIVDPDIEAAESAPEWSGVSDTLTGSIGGGGRDLAAASSLAARARVMRDALVDGQAFVEQVHVDVILVGFNNDNGDHDYGRADGASRGSTRDAFSVETVAELLNAGAAVTGDNDLLAYVMERVGRTSTSYKSAHARQSRNVAPRHDRPLRLPLLLRRRLVWHVQAAGPQLAQAIRGELASHAANPHTSKGRRAPRGGQSGPVLVPSGALDAVLAADSTDRQHDGYSLYIIKGDALSSSGGAALPPYCYVTSDPVVDGDANSAHPTHGDGGRRCYTNSGVAPMGVGRFAWLDVSAGPDIAYGPGSAGSGFVSTNLSHPFRFRKSGAGDVGLLVNVLNFVRTTAQYLLAPPMARFPVVQRPKLTVALVVASSSEFYGETAGGADGVDGDADPAGPQFRWAELRSAIRELAPEPVVQFTRVDLELPALNPSDDWADSESNQVHVVSPGRRRSDPSGADKLDDRAGEADDEFLDDSDGPRLKAARFLNVAVAMARREQLVTSHVDGSVLLRSHFLDSAVLDKHLHRFADNILNHRVLGVSRRDLAEGYVLPVLLFNFGDDQSIRLLDQHDQAVSLYGLGGPPTVPEPGEAQTDGLPSNSANPSLRLPLVVAVQTGAGRVFTDFVCRGPAAGVMRGVTSPSESAEISAVVDLRDASRAILAQIAEAAWGVAPTHVAWPLSSSDTEQNYLWSLQNTPFGMFGGGRSGRTPLEWSFVQRDAAARHIVFTAVNETLAAAVAVLDRMLTFHADLQTESAPGRAGDALRVPPSLESLLSASQLTEMQRRLNLLVFKLAEASRSLTLRLHDDALALVRATERDVNGLFQLLLALERRTASSLLCPVAHDDRQQSNQAAGNLALLLVAWVLGALLLCIGLTNGSLHELGRRLRRALVSRQKKID